MGWFDESDEEDEQQQQQQQQQDVKQKEAVAHQIASGKVDDEEEDPLDAFMNQLATTQASNEQEDKRRREAATSSSNGRLDANGSHASLKEDEAQSRERLDFDNEDEATSHWSTSRKQSTQGNDDDDDSLVSGAQTSEQAKRARQALETQFVRAGGPQGKSKQEAVRIPTSKSGNEGTATDRVAFNKVFWNPSRNDNVERQQADQWRQKHQVTVSYLGGGNKPTIHANTPKAATILDPIYHLDELREVFGPPLSEAIAKQGFTIPTAVQSQALPLALAGHNLLVTAATGQGKTLAYLWPTLIHIANQPALLDHETGPLALVLCPTRELALQVHNQYARPLIQAVTKRRSKVVIGGQEGKYRLIQELKRQGMDLVVATPGRLLDVLHDRKGLSLKRCTLVVLDEVDKMLAMGFSKQVTEIMQNIRPDRQTLLFSATLTRRIEGVASQWLGRSALRIAVGRTGQASEHVLQHVVVLPHEQAKKAFLVEMLPTFAAVGRILVFCATRESCETLAAMVRQHFDKSVKNDNAQALAVETLHGDKHQSDRNSALKAFRSGLVKILIATDVAARGLDVPSVATVLQYDAPKNLDAHVHRIGRAGRLDKNATEQQIGSAYALLTRKDADFAQSLRQAWEREGREVSPALVELAQQSRHAVGRHSSSRNKAGVGAVPLDAPPPAKRSRWQ